jgi:serine/threonine protein kinase
MTGPGVQDPTTVGPYRLVQRLGEGGMGVVHLALDPAGRAVALKLLRTHVAADPEARLRLTREVETLRRVRHARVAEVLDADVAGQVPYLVTRFVPGRTLDQHVRDNGPLPAEQVADLGRGLAAALQAIHAAGVVHRDIKPANVMLVDGQPVLIDFGIAHITDESRITVTGLVMGTPGYLSPEVVDGHPVSWATDWWGWAATLAFAASGRPPFGTGPMEVVLDRVRRGAADLDGVDPLLRSVLGEALVPDPRRRAGPGHLLSGLAGAGPMTPDRGLSRAAAPTERTLRQPPPGQTVRTPPPNRTAHQSPPSPGRGRGAGGPSVAASSAGGAPVTRAYPGGNGCSPPGGPSARANGMPPGAPNLPPPPPPGGSGGLVARGSGAGGYDPYVSYPGLPGGHSGGAGVSGGCPGGTGAGGCPGGPGGSQGAGQGVIQGQGGTTPAVWEPPEHGVGPVRPTGTLLGVLAALTGVTAVAPVGALVIAAALMVLARTVDRTATMLYRRRQDAGRRSGDVAVAVVAAPWRLVQSLFSTAFAMVLPLLVGVSVAFILDSGAQRQGSMAAGTPSTAGALAAAGLATLFTAWWGPGGGPLRRGSRAMARAALRNSGVRITVWVLLTLVVLSSLIVVSKHQGTAPAWGTFWIPNR